MNTALIGLIVVITAVLAYNIGAYYGEKIGVNIGKNTSDWNRFREEREICDLKWESGYKCNCPSEDAKIVCNHYDWNRKDSTITGWH